ncbi:MAG TPA: HAMP domain-containing sensor histidine kinase [Ktedonobacteraceae bacterium]|nr:HAMP domain-containing sensor histidine kinase [Ktedonobacteraceae bacterium]
MQTQGTPKHIRWWQSIRWRLALGSMLVALLATIFIALAALLAITYYYGVDQHQLLDSLATDKAQSIGANYTQTHILATAAGNTLPRGLVQSFQGEQYLLVVINRLGQTVYPHYATKALESKAFGIALDDPTLNSADFSPISNGVRTAFLKGMAFNGEIGNGGPNVVSRPFVAQPIFDGTQSGAPVVGALVIISRAAASNTIPPFIATVGQSVLIVAAIIAVLAALAAILFARTITRPLATLTKAAHVLASGNYNARVATNTHGEIEELADTFNNMAAKLAADVDELRRQELWRRELIMNITHDLASPLTAITGLGESLIDGVNQSRDDYEATGRVIVRETLRLRRLVKDLHMMAKVEAGAIEPVLRPVRLAALVDEVLAVQVAEFERKNVEPLNMLSYALPSAYADPDMLSRVFSNLCDNALRHTPSGGAVTIEAIQRGTLLMVSIADSGEGIPPDALPRVFDRFYRADSARQASTGGSGLGLAIVKAIIEAHEGSIWAENIPDSGARFVFTLPVAVTDTGSITSEITMPMRPTP